MSSGWMSQARSGQLTGGSESARRGPGLRSFVDALKDVREVAGLDQADEDLGHLADAGVADDEAIRAREVGAAEGLPGRRPPLHDGLHLSEGDDGRTPPGSVVEVHEDVDVVHRFQVLAGIRQERRLEVLRADSVPGSVPSARMFVVAHRASVRG